jgi:hypothetical protein
MALTPHTIADRVGRRFRPCMRECAAPVVCGVATAPRDAIAAVQTKKEPEESRPSSGQKSGRIEPSVQNL